MSNGEDGSRPRRPRVLWFVFGGVAGLAAFGAVVLYWLVRRPTVRVPIVIDPVGTADPTTAPVDPVGPERGVDPDQPSGSSCDLTCDDSCSDSCSNSCNSVVDDVCNDLVNEACEQPMNDACGSTSGCDPDLSCDGGTAGTHLILMLTGGAPWMREATPQPRTRVTLPARLGIAAIRGYQRFLSRALGAKCRFSPSCSQFGVDALRKYGAVDGSFVTVVRIRRCTATVPLGTLDPA